MLHTMRGLLTLAAVVAAVILITVGGIALYQHFEGGLNSQHSRNQQHSYGAIKAANEQCHNDIRDYTAADADRARDRGDVAAEKADVAHMNALLADCKDAVAALDDDEVDADVAAFLRVHPSPLPVPTA